MKKAALILLGSFISIGLIACGSKRDTPYTSDTYFASNIRLFDPTKLETPPRPVDSTIVSFVQNQKIERREAINSFRAMQTAFRSSYIGYNLKEDLIGTGGNRIFNSCINDVERSSSKLTTFEYYDLVYKCLSRFKDSHINLSNMTKSSQVLTAISNAEMLEGKLYIERNRPQLIKKLEEIAKVSTGTYANLLKPGLEIISIDGLTPLEAVRNIMPYISASTNESHFEGALDVLFSRNFFYPKKSEITLVIRLPSGREEEVILPWLQQTDEKGRLGSPESRILLQEQGIVRTTDLSTESNFLFRNTKHALAFDMFSELTNKKTFENDDEEEVLTVGIARVGSKQACYLRLDTFSIDKDSEGIFYVKENMGTEKNKRAFFEVIKTFLTGCDAFSAPLVFDLRNNGGGNPEVADELITLLTKADAPKVFSARARLIESGNMSVLNGLLLTIDNKEPSLEVRLEFDSLTEAVIYKQPYSKWLLMRSLKNELAVYNQKVVALISHDCVSACEGMANRLKVSSRATLLGTATSGTGFGFSTAATGKSVFRDPLNLFEVKMPNHAFQAVQVADESLFQKNDRVVGSVVPFNSIKLQENNPVQPDIKVEYKLKDLTDNFSEYKKAIEAALQ